MPLPKCSIDRACRPRGGLTDRAPLSKFEGCPGSSLEDNRIARITHHRSENRLFFYVEFEKRQIDGRPFCSWVDLTVLRDLQPKYLLVDFMRKLYLYHRRPWFYIVDRAQKHDMDVEKLYISQQIKRALEDDKRERDKRKKVKWWHANKHEY